MATINEPDLYSSYYWQNKKVRLRLWQPKDSEYAAVDDLDTAALSLVHEEAVLPSAMKKVDLDGDSAEPNLQAPAFSIENLSGEYIGHIHFNYINERHGTFSIGMIIRKEHRGKGYGKAAIKILLEYAFNERRLHKFNGYCLDTNIASAKMMESLGCVREGTIRGVVFMNGSYHDQFFYGLTKAEYNGRHG